MRLGVIVIGALTFWNRRGWISFAWEITRFPVKAAKFCWIIRLLCSRSKNELGIDHVRARAHATDFCVIKKNRKKSLERKEKETSRPSLEWFHNRQWSLLWPAVDWWCRCVPVSPAYRNLPRRGRKRQIDWTSIHKHPTVWCRIDFHSNVDSLCWPFLRRDEAHRSNEGPLEVDLPRRPRWLCLTTNVSSGKVSP